MILRKLMAVTFAFGVLFSALGASAATMYIAVDRDTSVIESAPDSNLNDPITVLSGTNSHHTNAKGLFGFDMSNLASQGPDLQINSISFNAYVSDYGAGNSAGAVSMGVAIGVDDTWVDDAATYNDYGNQHRNVIAEADVTGPGLVSWDLGYYVDTGEFLYDGYMTIYTLFSGSGLGMLGFAAEESGLQGAFLAVDYTPVSAVPLPAALPLYGAGITVLGFLGWKRRKRTVIF